MEKPVNKTNIAILVLGALGCIVAAGLFIGDLADTAPAWGLLGVIVGALAGILVPAPE